jgi:hypothetical protein
MRIVSCVVGFVNGLQMMTAGQMSPIFSEFPNLWPRQSASVCIYMRSAWLKVGLNNAQYLQLRDAIFVVTQLAPTLLLFAGNGYGNSLWKFGEKFFM